MKTKLFVFLLFTIILYSDSYARQANSILDDRFYLDGLQGQVRSIFGYEEELYIEGKFKYSKNGVINGLAKWDENKWQNAGPSIYESNGQIFQLGGILFYSKVNREEGFLEIYQKEESKWELIAKKEAEYQFHISEGVEFEEKYYLIDNNRSLFEFDGKEIKKEENTLLSSQVYSAAEFEGRLFFSLYDYESHRGSFVKHLPSIVSWNGDTWVKHEGLITDSTAYIEDFTITEEALYGIEYNSKDTERAQVFVWDGLSKQNIKINNPLSLIFLNAINDTLYAGFFNKESNNFHIAYFENDNWVQLGNSLVVPVEKIVELNNQKYLVQKTQSKKAISSVHQLKQGKWINIDLSENEGLGFADPIRSFVEYKGSLFAGGDFKKWGNLTVNYIAELKENKWNPLGEGLPDIVTDLTIHDESLIAIVGNQQVFKWNGFDWGKLGNTFEGQNIKTAISYNDTLIIAGRIEEYNSESANNILMWDGEDWKDHSNGVEVGGFTGSIEVLHNYDGKLLASGLLNTSDLINKREQNFIKVFKGGVWQSFEPKFPFWYENQHFPFYAVGFLNIGESLTASMYMGYRVMASFDKEEWKILEEDPFQEIAPKSWEPEKLIQYNDFIIGTGSFSFGDSYPYDARSIAWFDENKWVPFEQRLFSEAYLINSILDTEDGLYIGGDFSSIADISSYSIARLDKNWTPLYVQTSNEDKRLDTPKSFRLYQNYPNPFNPETSIEYSLKKSSNIKVEVFDIAGRIVWVNEVGLKHSGEHSIKFNAENLSSGVYFYKITVGEDFDTKKMVLIK